MADFPPNLDDGELWLPSDIILDVGTVNRRPQQHRNPAPSPLPAAPPPGGFVYVDDVAYQLAALGLLDRPYMLQSSAVAVDAPVPASKPSSKPPAGLQVLKGGKPASRFEPPPVGGVAYDGFRPPAKMMPAVAGEAGRGAPPSGLPRSARGRQAPQRSPKPAADRFVPARTGAGSGRARVGGTGVFLPRVSDAPGSNGAGQTKKQHHGKGGEQRLQYTKSAAVWKKQQVMPFQSAAVMGLPQDWTY